MLSALAAISAAHGAEVESRALSERATHAKNDEDARQEDRASALRRAGHRAVEVEDYASAEGLCRQVVEICEGIGRVTVEDLASLGTALRFLGRSRESEETLRRATRSGDGPLHESTPMIVAHVLGVLFVQLERIEAARSTLERALGAANRKRPVPEGDVARLLHALAICDVDAGETARGLERLRAAMEIRARLFGQDALHAAMLATFARAQHREGNLEAAEQTFALALRRLGQEEGTRMLKAQVLVHLAELRLAAGQFEEAHRIVSLALQNVELVVDEHPVLCRARRVRARALRKLGRIGEADALEASVARILAAWAKAT